MLGLRGDVSVTDNEKWRAVVANDGRWDGVFYYAVRSTRVFCRPSCRSKAPLPENAVFFETAMEAKQNGYRPCKRCRPDLTAYAPGRELAEKAKALLDIGFRDGAALAASIRNLGVCRQRLDSLMKEQYGATFSECLGRVRLLEALALLAGTDKPVAEIAYGAGFESLSAFYRLFRRQLGTSPAHYRRDQAEKRVEP